MFYLGLFLLFTSVAYTAHSKIDSTKTEKPKKRIYLHSADTDQPPKKIYLHPNDTDQPPKKIEFL